MPYSWFRFYHEFASDPKVQAMAEADQRRLVMILCLRSCNVLETLQEEEIAHALNVTIEALHETKKCFIEKKFITENWQVRNWSKRQFISDSSTERVRKHRMKQKGNVTETLLKQDVTPSDTDSDTEKIKDIILYLNSQTAASYKPTSRKTIGLIKARFNEQFTVEDFKRVIDKKVAAWKGDSKMCTYLRPETLFGPKFEGYLNEPDMQTLPGHGDNGKRSPDGIAANNMLDRIKELEKEMTSHE